MDYVIIVNGKHRIEMPVIVAVTEDEQMTGLMGRQWPPPNMAFPYNSYDIRKFWMKNTPSPLDIVFCKDNSIIEICKGEPNSTALVGPESETNLVLEFPFGTCEAQGITQIANVELLLSPPTATRMSKQAALRAPYRPR